MPPNRGRAAKASSATSVTTKNKPEKDDDINGEVDDAEMAVETKKATKGKKKEALKENGHNEKPKSGRGRKKIDQQDDEIAEEAQKSSAKGKKKLAAKDENPDEIETRKSERNKKKELPKDEEVEEELPKKVSRGKKKAEPVEKDGDNDEVEEEPPKKIARGKKKVETVQNDVDDDDVEEEQRKKVTRGKKKSETPENDADEPTKSTKGRKKVEEKPVEKKTVEKPSKRGKKAKSEEPSDENSAEDEKIPVKRGGRKAAAPKDSSQEGQEEEEKKEEDEPEESGKTLKKTESAKSSKTKKTTKTKRNNEADDDDVPEPSTKKNKKDDKKPMNKTDSNLNEIDFSCDKLNAKGQKYNIKICSWNVAGLRSIATKHGVDYIKMEDADIIVLQETKCDENKIPSEWNLSGYKRYYLDSQKKSGYAGIAFYTKKEPINVKYGLDEKFDDEGRLITAEYDNFYVLNVYVPNAGRGLINLAKRLEWNNSFKKYVKELDEKKPVLICGDMNVAHQEIDLTNPKTNMKNAGFSKEEREGMTDFLANGFIDTFRKFYPDKTGAYTFWSYMNNSRNKNVGWRLDYFIVSDRIKDNICDNVMRSAVYGSDHCPIVLYANL